MLIQPVVQQIQSIDYFSEVRFSKDVPSFDDLRQKKIDLPLCYLLPVKDSGYPISSDNRPKQLIESLYSICIVTSAGDEACVDEPPMTEARTQLLNALLGFSVAEEYTPMQFVDGQLKDMGKKIMMWLDMYSVSKTYRK
ncbi:MAG: hypothetical protein HRT38_02740 [Alteromonadaceae bacterium]|nr:hypothetical protein [Alteromonadaceae bacterium]